MNKKLAKKLNKVLPDLKAWLSEPDSPGTLCVVERTKDGEATFLFVISIEKSHIESVESYFEMVGNEDEAI